MKTLKEVTDLLVQNRDADYQIFVDEGIAIINGLMTTRYNKRVPRSEEDKEVFRSNFLTLIEITRKYIPLAIEVNPFIVAYNQHIKNVDLPSAKVVAQQLTEIYDKHKWRELRHECGKLRTKKKWLKIHVSLRNDMYYKMDYAAKQLEMAQKIKKRKNRLDAKVGKSRWAEY